MGAASGEALGLIAGQGELPLAVARQAASRGRRVAAIAFHGQTDPRLEGGAEVTWLHPGQVGAALATLQAGAEVKIAAAEHAYNRLVADCAGLRSIFVTPAVVPPHQTANAHGRLAHVPERTPERQRLAA